MKVRNIKKLRLAVPYSLNGLAKEADVAIDTIRRAKRGDNIHPVNIRKLAKALQVEHKDITVQEDEEAEPRVPLSALVAA